MAADYGFYRSVYRGEALEREAFERLIGGAVSYVDNVTLGRARARECDEVRLAQCAVAEAAAREEEGVESESVGRYSVRYRGFPEGSLFHAAALYLEGTDLLYPGI